MRSALKPVIEFGPVAVFFYYFFKTGEIQSAILPLMIAAAIAIVASILFEKRVPPMLLFSTVLIFIFGSLTIYFNDPFFIKLKVTIVNLIFALLLYLYFLRFFLYKKICSSNLSKMVDHPLLQSYP